mmetsp:Transcript_13913/g.32135  ORF Transcript_13913/g.32135 Transcript_13913/m.32135 type:complete len:85 (-) Transcript_13913:488-742(-)
MDQKRPMMSSLTISKIGCCTWTCMISLMRRFTLIFILKGKKGLLETKSQIQEKERKDGEIVLTTPQMYFQVEDVCSKNCYQWVH